MFFESVSGITSQLAKPLFPSGSGGLKIYMNRLRNYPY